MSHAETYLPKHVHPFDFEDQSHEDAALSELHETRVGRAQNGQHFSAIHANRAVTERSIVRLNSLFGSAASVDQQYIGSQYAAAFPDWAYFSIDLPGHGASDPLTKEQRRDIKTSNGSLKSVSAAQVEAVLSIMPDMKEAVVTGEALGELMAVEFAAQAARRGIKVRRMFGFDPMGMENRTPIQLASSYLANAQKSRMERRKKAERPGEQALEDAFSKVFVPKIEKLGPTHEVKRSDHVGVMTRERAVAQLMLTKSPITRDTGMEALERALETQPELKAHLVFAGRSAIGRLTFPVKDKLDRLAFTTKRRVQYEEWHEDGQDIGLARHQPRLVRYVDDHMD
jgi:pimeloyl-ACP methyl ester carboxylesterase